MLFACNRPPAPRRLLVRASASRHASTAQQDAPRLTGVVEVTGVRRRALPLDGCTGGAADGAGGLRPLPALQTIDDAAAAVAASPVEVVKAFFLPRGWPGSVTPDYLEYQLWSIPAHVTGWASHSLATSSMLQAIGLGLGPAATAGTSAAIKWITKDGLGAVGRLFVGGKLSSVFDEDPKRWRMNAEFVTTLGLALEIATQLSPANFVLLAGAGTLAKALGKGMGRPCFRVVQTYFSATNNVGDVAAKEEVWEVTAQMLGLATSVAVLRALEAANQPEALIIPIWALVHAVHVALRYRALSALRFPYPNQRMSAALVMAHLREGRVPSIEAVGRSDNALLTPLAVTPRAVFGCTVEVALQGGLPAGGSGGNGSGSPAQPQGLGACLEALAGVYAGEQYMLTWQDRTAYVLLWEGAGANDYLRAMYQAACLEESGADTASLEQLADSLACMRARWEGFVEVALAQGWQLDKTVVLLGGTLLQRVGA